MLRIERVYYLVCDHPGCDDYFHGWEGESRLDVRLRAKDEADWKCDWTWKEGSRSSRDLCKDHTVDGAE